MPRPSRSVCVLVAAMLLLTVAACGDEHDKAKADAGPVYVAIGASESVGTGARNPSTDGWVPQLAAMMPAGTRLVNVGIAGVQTRQAVEQELPVAVDLHPAVVTVWLAANDYSAGVPLSTYRVALDELLATLARDTKARIYVANLPDLAYLPAFSDRPRAALAADVKQWNSTIAEVAAANGATLVDLYTDWTELRDHPGYISRDGLHPSTRGHRRIAELFARTIGAGS